MREGGSIHSDITMILVYVHPMDKTFDSFVRCFACFRNAEESNWHLHTNPDGKSGGWVENTAYVAPTAYLSSFALVFGRAKVLDEASINQHAWVFGNAVVRDGASVQDQAWVFGDAELFEYARAVDKSRVFGRAKVHGYAKVMEEAEIFEDAHLSGYMRVGNHNRVFGPVSISPSGVLEGLVFDPPDHWRKVVEEHEASKNLPSSKGGIRRR